MHIEDFHYFDKLKSSPTAVLLHCERCRIVSDNRPGIVISWAFFINFNLIYMKEHIETIAQELDIPKWEWPE